jgi:hypothetical protein
VAVRKVQKIRGSDQQVEKEKAPCSTDGRARDRLTREQAQQRKDQMVEEVYQHITSNVESRARKARMRRQTVEDTQDCFKCHRAGTLGTCKQGEYNAGAGAVECSIDGETTGCGNQRLHLQHQKRMFIAESGESLGCFQAEPAQEGDLIVEYVGVFAHSLTGHNEYSMAVPGGFLVVAARGTDSRLINPSCCGNAVPTTWTVQKEYRVGVFAANGIQAGEEVKMDYSWEHLGGERTACNCGEVECRGSLGALLQCGGRRSRERKWQQRIRRSRLARRYGGCRDCGTARA